MANQSDLIPNNLKPGAVDGANLKPGLVTFAYTGGTPTGANQVKPTLLDDAGNLKPGLMLGSLIKPGLLGDGVAAPSEPELLVDPDNEILTDADGVELIEG